jgi:hypothetical protein
LLVIRRSLSESILEVLEEDHRTNLASIVSEKEATNGRDDTQEDGFNAAVGAIDLDRPGGGRQLALVKMRGGWIREGELCIPLTQHDVQLQLSRRCDVIGKGDIKLE